jgi:hypothetical protein
MVELKKISTEYSNISTPTGGETLRRDVFNTIIACGLFVDSPTEKNASLFFAAIDTVQKDVESIRSANRCSQ